MSNKPIVAPFITPGAFQVMIEDRVHEQLFRLQDPMDLTSAWDHAVELGRCGEVPPLAAILSFYRDDDPEVREKVLEVVNRIGLGVEHLLIKVIKQRVESLYHNWYRPELIDKEEGNLEAHNLIDIAVEVLITRIVVPLELKQNADEQVRQHAITALQYMHSEIDSSLKTVRGMPDRFHPETYTENTPYRDERVQLYPAMVELCQLIGESLQGVQHVFVQEAVQGWSQGSEEVLFD